MRSGLVLGVEREIGDQPRSICEVACILRVVCVIVESILRPGRLLFWLRGSPAVFAGYIVNVAVPGVKASLLRRPVLWSWAGRLFFGKL